jgi:hypothetical protein
MDKAFMKRGHSTSVENIGLASHFHRSRAKVFNLPSNVSILLVLIITNAKNLI